MIKFLDISIKRRRPESNREIPKESSSQDCRSTIVPRRLLFDMELEQLFIAIVPRRRNKT